MKELDEKLGALVYGKEDVMPNKALIVVGPNKRSMLREAITLERRLAEIDYELKIVNKSPEIPERGVPIVPTETLWVSKM